MVCKVNFFQIGIDLLKPGKNFFFDFKLALQKIQAELSSQMCGSTVI